MHRPYRELHVEVSANAADTRPAVARTRRSPRARTKIARPTIAPAVRRGLENARLLLPLIVASCGSGGDLHRRRSGTLGRMQQRPCDCARRHRRFVDGQLGAQVAPVMHRHEDACCSAAILGIGGCPSLPHCRDWIVGAFRAGETMAEVTGDEAREFEIRLQREELVREFARRPALGATVPGSAEP